MSPTTRVPPAQSDRGPAVDELQGLDARAREDAHALLLEIRLQEVAQLLVLAVGEVLAPLDDRHLGAQPPVGLGELERHGAGADADEMTGQLGDVHQVVARHGRDVGRRPGTSSGRGRAPVAIERVREGDPEVFRLERRPARRSAPAERTSSTPRSASSRS